MNEEFRSAVSGFSMDWFRLDGKVAMITGGNQNLGLGYAVALARAGADIFIPHFTEDVSEVREFVEAAGRKIAFIRGDLTKDADRKAAIAECVRVFGRLDILINNAGTNHFEDFMDFPDEQYNRVLELNLKAVYFMAHEAARIMIPQGGGKIINIGSALSYTGDKKCPSYVTAKHGVIGITRAFANEVGQYNIQTNCICPGFFKTDVNLAVSSDEAFYNHITGRISHGRWGTPADLMGTAVFLASEASDYINGADIKVDGGFSTVI